MEVRSFVLETLCVVLEVLCSVLYVWREVLEAQYCCVWCAGVAVLY